MGYVEGRRWLTEDRRTKIEQAFAWKNDLDYVMSETGEDHATVVRALRDMDQIHLRGSDVSLPRKRRAKPVESKPAEPVLTKTFDATACKAAHSDFVLGYTSTDGTPWTYCKSVGWHQ